MWLFTDMIKIFQIPGIETLKNTHLISKNGNDMLILTPSPPPRKKMIMTWNSEDYNPTIICPSPVRYLDLHYALRAPAHQGLADARWHSNVQLFMQGCPRIHHSSRSRSRVDAEGDAQARVYTRCCELSPLSDLWRRRRIIIVRVADGGLMGGERTCCQMKDLVCRAHGTIDETVRYSQTLVSGRFL